MSAVQESVTVTIGPPYPAKPDDRPALGSPFEEALVYAAFAHRNQLRKGGSIPYLSHLLGVASLVLDHGGDEAAAAAALLHDCIEDCGIEHEPFILEAFGEAVLGIVQACSDAAVKQDVEKPPWRARKEAYLRHLEGQEHRVLLVSACDKLHNARAILSDLRSCGQSVWLRFNRPEPDQLWYYRSLADAFMAHVPAIPGRLADELDRTVSAIERISAELRA